MFPLCLCSLSRTRDGPLDDLRVLRGALHDDCGALVVLQGFHGHHDEEVTNDAYRCGDSQHVQKMQQACPSMELPLHVLKTLLAVLEGNALMVLAHNLDKNV